VASEKIFLYVLRGLYNPNAKYKIVKAEGEDKLDGDPIDTGKAIEHYEGTLEALKGIDLEVQDDTNGEGYRGDNFYNL
jgi:hypothetical protein